MRYDIWKGERDQAEVVEPYGVRVLRHSVGKAEAPVLKIWRPKAIKPEVNFRFGSAGQREQYVENWLAKYAREQAAKAERQAERKSVEASAPRVTVGTIFCHSWGWDQTNVDYYEVVRVSRSGQQVDVKPIGSEEVPGSQGFMSATVRPVPGAFINKTYRLQDAHGNYKQHLTKRVQYTDKAEPYLSFEYGWCGVTTPKEGRVLKLVRVTSIEYLAGLFDGEGSFSIQVGLRHYGAVPTGWVNPAMSVNLYYGTAVLERFVERLGGQIYPYTKNGAPRGARWHLGQRDLLLPAVDALLPHLEIKREIAGRFREALLLMPPDGRGPDRRSGGRVWRAEQVLAVAEIALSLNPPRARKSSKTAEYIDMLRGALS